MRETEAYWKALWSIALTLAVEKHLGLCPELSGPLDKMVRNEHLRSACDLFTNLLALVARRLFRGVQGLCCAPAAGVPAHPQLGRDVHRQHRRVFRGLSSQRPDRHRGATRVYRSYWHFAQVGIALAARDLHAINNHVKIFVSIRKEVFQRTFLGNPLGLQLAGSAWTCSTRAKT